MSSLPRRTLALLDVDNLLPFGPGSGDEVDYRYAVECATTRAELPGSAHVVIGTGKNPRAVFGARAARPGAAVRTRGGIDGADHVLSAQLADLEQIRRSYGAVVIGSGDGHFVDDVIRLNTLGMHTTVVAWEHKLSRRLRLAATEVLLLSPPSPSDLCVRLAS